MEKEKRKKKKNIGMGWHFLLQGIFPTQGLNLVLLHCKQILYHLSHQRISFCYACINTQVQTHIHVYQLSVDRHLDCFHILAIVNDTTVNIEL